MKTMPRRGSPRGFSLIELVVVISILAILALLAVGAMGKVREQRISLGCVSNLRQLGPLFVAYSADNRGQIDFHFYYTPGSTRRWSDFLIDKQYLRELDPIARCPLPPPFRNEPGHTYGGLGKGNPVDPYSRFMHGSPESRIIQLNSIENPARYWLLVDSWSASHRDQLYVVGPGASASWQAHLRHQGRANVLFADGHVESMTAQDLSALPFNPLPAAYDAEVSLVR